MSEKFNHNRVLKETVEGANLTTAGQAIISIIPSKPQTKTMLQGPNSARKSESDAIGSAVGDRVGKKETFEDREMVFG